MDYWTVQTECLKEYRLSIKDFGIYTTIYKKKPTQGCKTLPAKFLARAKQ